jgi:predicted site-specific integrase-resolvase
MPVTLNDQTYYRTAEVCRMVGICRNTLFRWFKEDSLREAQHRDRRGWRLFTEDEIDRLKAEANRISKTEQFKTKRGSQLSRHFS